MNFFTLRPFQSSEQEYEALSSLLRIVSPEKRPESAEDLAREDGDWPTDSLLKRVAAYAPCEEMVAVGTCYEAYWQESAFTVHLHFDTHPDHPQSQLLPVLYEGVQALLGRRKRTFKKLVSRAREDDIDRVRFLQGQGFREELRFPSSVLHVAEFDTSVCAGAYDRLAQNRVRVTTLAELQENEPDWKKKLHDLRWNIVQDVPSTEPFSKPTVAEFEEMVLKDPALDEDAFFVALAADGSLIGMSNLWRNDPEGKHLDTGLTGVVKSHRRRGIATALKLRTVEYAQAGGAETIRTRNEKDSPLIAINLGLGFEPEPAWVDYVKESGDL